MKDLVSEIRSIIETSRSNAVRSVDFCRVQMYWQIGRRIVEEEQGGSARAEYGKGLIKNLAQEIEPEYGSGFSYRQFNFARQFFLEYPKVNALRSQFNWTQINSMLYERLILSNDKESVLAMARKERAPEAPQEIIPQKECSPGLHSFFIS